MVYFRDGGETLLMRRLTIVHFILVLCVLSILASPISTFAARTPLFVGLFMSPLAAPTSLADFRRAIASSIDRQAVISAARQSIKEPSEIIPATGVLDPRLPRYSDGTSFLYAHDPTEAQRFLSSVGWGEPLTITVVTGNPSRSHLQASAGVIGRNIHDVLGLEVSYRYLTPDEAAPYIDSGTLALFIGAWHSGYPSGSTPNSIGIAQVVYKHFPDVNRLVASGDAAAIQRVLLEQALVVPLYFTVSQ
jgi:ABC-type transport system substrate-binding protein